MDEEKQIEELRKLFPVVKHWTYLYNGSIHSCPLPVGDAMRHFLEEWQQGGEIVFFKAYEAFKRLKEKFAHLIHGNARNIVITESTTAGINLAAQLIGPQPEQNVVVTDLAFMSNTYPFIVSQSAVEDVRFVKSHNGKIYMEDLEAQVDEHTALVHICAVTVGSGFRYPLDSVYKITSRFNVPLIIDGAQALGLIDINVNEPPLHFLASTASKWLMGPAGVGFLHVADKYLNETPPTAGWLSAANADDWDVKNCMLYEDANRFQGGIPNLIGVVGALAGLEFLEKIGREFIEKRVRKLTTYALEGLKKMGVEIWTPHCEHERAGIVFFRTPGYKELHARLKEERVYCGSFLSGIRFDPNFYNTYEELDKLLEIVRSHVRQYGD
jgi:selenocysteine lyase/cysteine desulfurase